MAHFVHLVWALVHICASSHHVSGPGGHLETYLVKVSRLLL
jgi:hypothetical protein